MEAELQPYRFLRTDYNKHVFRLTEDDRTATLIDDSGSSSKRLNMSRPIGRHHRLVVEATGSAAGCTSLVFFTTCDVQSVTRQQKHLDNRCPCDCSGKSFRGPQLRLQAGSRVSIMRTGDCKIEAVFSDPPETKLFDVSVGLDVPLLPYIYLYSGRGVKIRILPDELGLITIEQQILDQRQTKLQPVVDSLKQSIDAKLEVLTD